MSRRVSLSFRVAVWLWDNVSNLHRQFEITGANVPREFKELTEAVLAAKKTKRSVSASRVRRVAKKATKKEEAAAIRDLVFDRANGNCEGCGLRFSMIRPAEMDHFFGRVRVRQSERNCWMLCRGCHRAKTANTPSAAHWLASFHVHATRHGYAAEARLAQNRVEAFGLSGRAASMTRGAPDQ